MWSREHLAVKNIYWSGRIFHQNTSLGKDFSVTTKTLLSLKKGECGTVASVSGHRRLMDMGCISGACVIMLGEAPFGGMRAYRICGAVIALRESDAKNVHILVENR